MATKKKDTTPVSVLRADQLQTKPKETAKKNTAPVSVLRAEQLLPAPKTEASAQRAQEALGIPYSAQRAAGYMAPAKSNIFSDTQREIFENATAFQKSFGTLDNFLLNKRTTKGGFFSRPEPTLGQSTAYHNAVLWDGAMQYQQKRVQDLAAQVSVLATGGPNVDRTGIYRDYVQAVNNYRSMIPQYNRAIGTYNGMAQAAKKLNEDWRRSIRSTDEIDKDVDALRQEIAAKWNERQTHAAQLTSNPDRLLPSALETRRKNEQAMVDRYDREIANLRKDEELLQEERFWSVFYKYEDLRNNPDFAELSKVTDRYMGGTFGQEYIRSQINRDPDEIGRDDLMLQTTDETAQARKMTDREREIYNYLYNTQGAQVATDYFKELTGDHLNRQLREDMEKYTREATKRAPLLMSTLSVVYGPAKSLGFLAQGIDFALDGTIDENAPYNKVTHMQQAIRDERANYYAKLAETKLGEGWGKLGSFGYQTAMSMADFIFNAAITGNFSVEPGTQAAKVAERLSLGIMSTGAAADATVEAKERGLTDGQAIVLGTVAGFAEYFTEKVSLELLLDKVGSRSGWWYLTKNVLAEGSEEVASDLINLGADIWISQDKSEWQRAIRAYENQGFDKRTAFQKAWNDQALGMLASFAGGAISGGVMAGGSLVLNSIAYDQTLRNTEAADERVRQLVEAGKVQPEDTRAFRAAQALEERISRGEKINLKDAMDAARTVNRAIDRDLRSGLAENIGRNLLSEQMRPVIEESVDYLLSTKRSSQSYKLGQQILNKLTNGENITAQEAGEAFLQAEKVASGEIGIRMERDLKPREVTAEMDELERSAAVIGVPEREVQNVKRIAEALGRKVLYESVAPENGKVQNGRLLTDGTIMINALGVDPYIQVFSHELTHDLEGTDAYEALSKLILSRIENIDAERERLGKLYKDGTDIDKELVAFYVQENLLQNERAIYDVVNQNRSFGQWMLGKIDDLLAKLGNQNAKERAFLRKTRRLYVKALRENGAQRNGEAASYSEISRREDQDLRDRIREIEDQLDMADFNGLSNAEIRKLNGQLYKAQAQLDQFTAKQRGLAKKTSINEIIRDIEDYDRMDLESLAEQVSDMAWDDYDELSDAELREALVEALKGRFEDMEPGDADKAKYGFYVKPPQEKVLQLPMVEDRAPTASEFLDEGTKYSLREEEPPVKTGVAYKVFVVKDGKLYPPMVPNPGGADTPVGVWLNADTGVRAPDSKTGRLRVESGGQGTSTGRGTLAFRPGWHLGEIPDARQFAKLNKETGKKELFPANFVWAECEYAMDQNYQEEAMSYGYTENGKFRHSYAGLPRIPVNGYYQYRTNPNPDTVPWIITGAIKVNRILTDAETDQLCRNAGIEPLKREGGPIDLEKYGLKAGEVSDGTRYSFSEEPEGLKLPGADEAEYFKDSKARDKEGNLLTKDTAAPEAGPDFMRDIYQMSDSEIDNYIDMMEEPVRTEDELAEQVTEPKNQMQVKAEDAPAAFLGAYAQLTQGQNGEIPGQEMVSTGTKAKAKQRGSVKDAGRFVYRKMVDSGEAVSRLGKYSEDRHLYYYYNMARASSNAAVSMIQDAQTNVRGEKVGESLNDIFKTIRAKGQDYYADLQAYLYHMHNIDRMSREDPAAILRAQEELEQFRKDNPEIAKLADFQIQALASDPFNPMNEDARLYAEILGRLSKASMTRNKPVFNSDVDAEASRQAVSELLNRLEDVEGFEEDVRNIYQYIDNLMRYRIESGLITEEDYRHLKEIYPHYVPVYYEQEIEDIPTRKKDKTEIGKTIGRAKGNETMQKIMPLHKSLAKQTFSVVREGSKNRFGTRLLDMQSASKGMIDDVQKYAGDFHEDTFDDERRDDEFKKTHTFIVREDGQRWEMTLDNALYEAVDVLSPEPEEVNLVTKVIRGSNELFKALCTGYNPTFLVRNFMRDLQDAGLYSKDLSEFAKNYPLAVKEIATNGKYWQQYKALGGLYSSIFDYQTGELKQSNKFKRYTFDKIEAVNMAVEQAPRLAEFMATVKKAERAGDLTMDTLMQAMYNAADVTVNFGRSGKIGKMLNRNFVPFLNPGIQGFDKMIRNVSETKGFKDWARLTVKATLLGIAPAILSKLLFGRRKDWDEIKQRDKDIYYLFPLDDNGHWLKLPKGRTLSIFGMAADRTMSQIEGKDTDWIGLLTTSLEQTAPANPLTNNIWQPIVGTKLFNPDNPGETWYGTDIESKRLQNLAPEERYDASTSEISKFLGRTFKLSPAKINYLLDQYSGVLGDIVLPLTSARAEKDLFTAAFTVDTETSNRLSGDFYEKLDELTYQKNDPKASPESAAVYKYFNKASSDVSEINKVIRSIEEDKNLSDKEKRELTRVQYALRNEVMRNALENVGQYAETAKRLYKISLETDEEKRVGEAYRMTNYAIFGPEYALQVYNKEVYKKAQALYDGQGISYEDFYNLYFQMQAIKVTGYEESNAKRNLIKKQGLSDSQKAALVEKIFPQENMDRIQTLRDAGIRMNMILSAKNEYARISAGEGSSAQKRTELARWVYGQRLTEKQKPLLLDEFNFYTSTPAKETKYETFLTTGIPEQKAYDIAVKMGELQPLAGKTTVSNEQKCRVIVDSGMSTADQLTAIRAILNDDAYRPYAVAQKMGVEPSYYVGAKEAMPKYDEDHNGSYKNDEVTAMIEDVYGSDGKLHLPGSKALNNDQKAVLWQLLTGSTSAKNNPYSVEIGNQVLAAKAAQKETDGKLKLPG